MGPGSDAEGRMSADSSAAALLEVADDSEIELLNVALKTHRPRNASPSPALRWCKVDGVADEAKQTRKERRRN
jgi:hypothetical protein